MQRAIMLLVVTGLLLSSSCLPFIHPIGYLFADGDSAEPEETYTGIAPYAAVFNAIDMADVIQPPLVDERREYADFHYSWDFGDAGSGTWPHSARSKNTDLGYVTAHVYDTPGTYMVSLRVVDAEGKTHAYARTVTVRDPEVIFGGGKTVCVSTGTDFSEAPAGARQVTTSDILDIEPYFQTGRRILLHRGDTWTTDGVLFIQNVPGPFALGAFGTGVNPDERGIYENAPHIICTGTVPDTSFITYWDVNNWQIMDLHISGDYTREGGIGGGTYECSNMLHYRMNMDGFGTPIGTSHWDTDGNYKWMLIDSAIHDAGESVVYTGSEKLVVMGNLLYHSNTTHVLRVWQGYKAVISHNVIHGSSMDNTNGRHALKLHGPGEALLTSTDGDHLKRRSRYIVVYDNLFGTSGPWPIRLGSQDSATDERVGDILIEGNKFLSGYGELSATPVQISLRIAGGYVTVRNNIFNGALSSNGYTAVQVESDGFIPAIGNRIYNNSIYDPDAAAGGEFAGVCFTKTSKYCMAKNNLAYLVNDPAIARIMIDHGAYNLTGRNILAGTEPYADPANGDYHLTPGAAAIDAGEYINIRLDFDGNPRSDGAVDVGAFED